MALPVGSVLVRVSNLQKGAEIRETNARESVRPLVV
jgi:hypothetical protein